MSTRSPISSPRALTAIAAIAGFALALSGTPAHAQQSEVDLLRQQIAELSARLQKLEDAQVAQKSAPAPTVQSSSKLPVTVSGLLQEQANAYFNQDSGATKLNDTLRLRRGELRLTAPTLTSRVSGTVMFDVAKTDNRNRAGSLLQELLVSYNLDKNVKAPKFIDVGQYKPGFGYEGDLVSSGALQMIERAQIYNFRDLATIATAPPVPGLPGGGLGDSRDQGVRLRGAFGAINYNVGVFNGLGETQNDSAKGDPKAVVGRAYYKAPDGTWMLGASALTANTRNVNAAGPLDRNGFNAFGAYKKDKISFQAEYSQLKSKVQNAPGAFKNGKGYYAGLGYLITPKVELTARYDSLKQEQTAGTGTSKEISGGINYYIKGNNAKIQANIVKVDGEANALSTSDSLQLRTQYQVSF